MDRLLALPLSALCVGALWLVLSLVLVVAWLLARRPVRRVDEVIAGRGALRRGPACIGGKVELAPDAPVPLEVTIAQTGTPKKVFYSMPQNVRDIKTVHYTNWETLNEKVEARPFFVRCADGERVRVEPPANVKFRGKMDVCVEHTELFRSFEARLRAGDEVFIEGTLSRFEPEPAPEPAPEPEKKGGGGYRAAAPREVVPPEVVPSMWILGPREGKPMLIARQPFRRPIPGALERRRVHDVGVGFWFVAVIGALAQIVLQFPLLDWAYGVIAVAAGVMMLLAVGMAFEKSTLPEPEDGLEAAVTKKEHPAPLHIPWHQTNLQGADRVVGSTDPNAGLGTGVDENGEGYGRIG
ncbi:hypothetical protein [Polyangium sp. y55x31]|uniref:hypothetical protein n=1 Tax=Polyangium sp. y55x31 TaxID=3042688 RepID=UPI002482CFEB|nr:hypothetical protein [Polyangium sp. y55x31]MDI1480274.1 hypothetical protein [Polyangium sp. y55x31]